MHRTSNSESNPKSPAGSESHPEPPTNQDIYAQILLILEDHKGSTIPFIKLCLEKERFPGHTFTIEKVNSLLNALMTKRMVEVESTRGSKKQRGPARQFILRKR